MHKIKMLIIVLFASLGLLGIVASPAAASPWTHRAVIKNGGSIGFSVCENWGSSGCRSDSARGIIYSGENSKTKFGWADTDGILNPTGRAIYRWGNAGGRPGWVYVSRAHEIKVSGCAGCTVKYKAV